MVLVSVHKGVDISYFYCANRCKSRPIHQQLALSAKKKSTDHNISTSALGSPLTFFTVGPPSLSIQM